MSTTVRLQIEGEPSFLSHSTGNEAGLLVHVTPMRSGSLDVVQVFTAGDGTISEVSRGDRSRSQLRKEFDEMSRAMKIRFAAAPKAYVAWRIARALERHTAAGKTLSRLDGSRVGAVAAPGPKPAHPAASLAPMADAETRVARSSELLLEPELMFFLPSESAIEEVGRFVRERPAKSGEGAEGAGEAVAGAFREGIDRCYGPEERASLAEKLRDLALVFAATKRPERALDAVATADAIEASNLLTTPPHQVPFIMGLFYKFAMLRDQLQKRAQGAR